MLECRSIEAGAGIQESQANLFIARQPILNLRLDTFAYELLFRTGDSNSFGGGDEVAATNAVISNTFLSLGLHRVMGRCRAFINFPRELLVAEEGLHLPPDKVVLEVLETVTPDDEVISACRRLKAQGYQLALDDFVKHTNCGPLVDLADFLKIDFCSTSPEDCQAICAEFGKRGIRMLAEKVETRETWECARIMGYGYFQGYFFARPQILVAREIPVCKMNALRLLRELQRPTLDFPRVDRLIRNDVSVAHKLLRLLNSAAFAWTGPIDSIFHGLVLMGECAVRRWVALAATASLASDSVPELVRVSVKRARLCELVAGSTSLATSAPECFLMGLFSLLDAMLGRPLSELLPEIGLRNEICAALCGWSASGSAHYRHVLDLSVACEAADVKAIQAVCSVLNLTFEEVARLHVESMSWADGVWRQELR